MKKTYAVRRKDIKEDWHLIDASDQVLGRVATRAATLLLGKDKPNFSANINVGGKVVVVNAEKVAVTGKKLISKKYYRHSGYPGGFKEETLQSLLERKPEEVIKKAVWGMLPVNKLRRKRILNLYVYKGLEHPHKAQLGN
ncbi:50S ribosomal protein L13 [candidate division WWE3 bacterium RIFCSPHIGHO2_01_FULL_40_23]|uniref:Large ribosomal subunit protein uL13 n=1 Tax=candidate division WWE3 bacterium RIFCSPLOWO2_01_FULL_41_18 TaxID=1802625 RepID=A0A1F4VD42_UNCKA|nr:MAG: 50S ribosomal protein L13 [candidate division WWE3 bacterium RIFCSPHIGHO2_01_FULL_40_23]OGC55141.1 MAG: 50S ribosomal protein L13 [candidate division WWE3 bacterium RIFCSPLOWO2_01_FULL_41_18]